MHLTYFACTILPLIISAAPNPRPSTQELPPGPPKPYQPNPKRADAVRQAFRDAWKGYAKVFGNDEIRPISGLPGNSRNGWGATPVDALTTAVVMGEKQIVNHILDFVPKINFAEQLNRMDSVSLFETTIRYLGGMLSAHDLLGPGGPGANLVDKGKNVNALLEQSKTLANLMSFAFDTPTGIPHNDLLFPQRGDTDRAYLYDSGVTDNGLATLGTLILEWTRLADKSGNQTYFKLADKAESYLLNPQPKSQEPFPGLISSNIDIATGQLRGGYVSWSGGADSFYEYLIKMFVYDPKRFGKYRDRWILAADSSIKHLAFTAQPADATFLREYSVTGGLVHKSGHLTCFDGGNFILGGIVLDRKDYIDFGVKLVHGCWKTYDATATGLGPERFTFDPATVQAEQQNLWKKGGFYLTQSDPDWAWGYYLRPEVLESIYHAYRATGNPIYQDWSWKAFEAIQAKCRTEFGYVGLVNVNNATSPFRIDNQESFFFAETLKYLYLIQAGDADWQVGGPGTPAKAQKWVYNTEAHPMKVFSGTR